MKLECEVGCFSVPKPSTPQQRIFDKMNQIENLMQELRYIGTNQEAMLWSSHQPGGDAMVLAPTRRRCYGPRTNQEAMLWSSLISSLDVGTTFPNSGKNKINLSFLTRPYYGAARGVLGLHLFTICSQPGKPVT